MSPVLAAALVLAASFAAAQEAEKPGALPSSEEVDRQLNNLLSETWPPTI